MEPEFYVRKSHRRADVSRHQRPQQTCAMVSRPPALCYTGPNADHQWSWPSWSWARLSASLTWWVLLPVTGRFCGRPPLWQSYPRFSTKRFQAALAHAFPPRCKEKISRASALSVPTRRERSRNPRVRRAQPRVRCSQYQTDPHVEYVHAFAPGAPSVFSFLIVLWARRPPASSRPNLSRRPSSRSTVFSAFSSGPMIALGWGNEYFSAWRRFPWAASITILRGAQPQNR